MGWGRKKRIRRATLTRDLNYEHPIMGPFFLAQGTQVILPSAEKVVDNYVVNAYIVLQRMGANPIIVEHQKRYYIVTKDSVEESRRTTHGSSRFRRS
tara:strand:+ start:153 stop:443 length:291 start_codon:yes stop_codon:yes gene_type:complete